MKTLSERRKILDDEILRLEKRGWRVEGRTDTTCMLSRADLAMGCFSLAASFLVLFPFFNRETIKTRVIEVSPEGIIKRRAKF